MLVGWGKVLSNQPKKRAYVTYLQTLLQDKKMRKSYSCCHFCPHPIFLSILSAIRDKSIFSKTTVMAMVRTIEMIAID
jgi:hypothetical protein